MKKIELGIPEVFLVQPVAFEDDRGWFMESYSLRKVEPMGAGMEFVQDNHSFSRFKGTLRGLHFQAPPHAQSKLVRCTRGSIFDVAIDLRKSSRTYLGWVSHILSQANRLELFVPKGFAHGFLTLEDNTEVQYKVDEYYDKECDRCIRYDDEQIGIVWPEVGEILQSAKDRMAPCLGDHHDVAFE